MIEHECTVCGEAFTSKAPHAKFCSADCKAAAETARAKAKREAESQSRAPLPAARCQCGGPGAADEDGATRCVNCSRLKPEQRQARDPKAARAALTGFIDSRVSNQQGKLAEELAALRGEVREQRRDLETREVALGDQLEAAWAEIESLRAREREHRRLLESAEARARKGGGIGTDPDRLADAVSERLADRLGDPDELADLIADRLAEREEFNVERQFLTTAEKAAQLGVSADTLRRNYRRYGGWKDGEVGEGKKPRLRFPVESGKPVKPEKPEPVSKPAKRRKRRRNPSLQIKGEGPYA